MAFSKEGFESNSLSVGDHQRHLCICSLVEPNISVPWPRLRLWGDLCSLAMKTTESIKKPRQCAFWKPATNPGLRWTGPCMCLATSSVSSSAQVLHSSMLWPNATAPGTWCQGRLSLMKCYVEVIQLNASPVGIKTMFYGDPGRRELVLMLEIGNKVKYCAWGKRPGDERMGRNWLYGIQGRKKWVN